MSSVVGYPFRKSSSLHLRCLLSRAYLQRCQLCEPAAPAPSGDAGEGGRPSPQLATILPTGCPPCVVRDPCQPTPRAHGLASPSRNTSLGHTARPPSGATPPAHPTPRPRRPLAARVHKPSR